MHGWIPRRRRERISTVLALFTSIVWKCDTAVGQPYAYVVNVGSNDVSVVNVASRDLVGSVPVGQQPNGIAIASDGLRAYVTNFRSDTVSVIDMETERVVGEIEVGHQPVGIAVSPDSTTLYVANRGSSSLSIIDLNVGEVTANVVEGIGPGPSGVALTPDGAFAYVNNAFSKEPGTVSVVDTRTGTVVSTVEVYRNPKRVAVSPDGAKAYVANFRSWNVSVVDVSANLLTTGLRVSGRTVGVAIHPNGRYAYVTNLDGRLEVVDIATDTLVDPIGVGREPYAVVVTQRGQESFEAYVANLADNSVSVVDLDRRAVVANIAVGVKPFALAINCTGPSCASLSATPKPTRPPTSTPTITVTPTQTPTKTDTPIPIPTPRPEDDVTLVIGSADAAPGQRVTASVTMQALRARVAGIQNDILFDNTKISLQHCRINPEIAATRPGCENDPQDGPCKVLHKNLAQCGTNPQPAGCPDDAGTHISRLRAIVVAVENASTIPSGELYACTFEVNDASSSSGEVVPLRCVGSHASDPTAAALPTNCTDGEVRLAAVPQSSAREQHRGQRAATGVEPRLCSAGPRDGVACTTDEDCPTGACVVPNGVCDGGGDDGLLCDCPGGSCVRSSSAAASPEVATCAGGPADGEGCDPGLACADGAVCALTRMLCSAGPAKGVPCIRAAQCQGRECTPTGRVCSGGEFTRFACVDDRDCPRGTCAGPHASSAPVPSGEGGGGGCSVAPRPSGNRELLPIAALVLLPFFASYRLRVRRRGQGLASQGR